MWRPLRRRARPVFGRVGGERSCCWAPRQRQIQPDEMRDGHLPPTPAASSLRSTARRTTSSASRRSDRRPRLAWCRGPAAVPAAAVKKTSLGVPRKAAAEINTNLAFSFECSAAGGTQVAARGSMSEASSRCSRLRALDAAPRLRDRREGGVALGLSAAHRQDQGLKALTSHGVRRSRISRSR